MNRKMKREMKRKAISRTKAVLAGILAVNTIGVVTAASLRNKLTKQLNAEAIANAIGKKTTKLEDASIALDQELNDNGDGTYSISLKTSSTLTYEDLCVRETKVKYGFFEAERTGKYMLELFGGDGANGDNTIYSHGGQGGAGGHVYAVAELNVGDILYYTIGGDGQRTLSNDTGGGANGDGGDHGDVGNYYVGGGGGYTALYKFSGEEDVTHFKSTYLNDDETLKRTDLLEEDRTNKYVMIAGGGGGGGAGNAFSLIDKAIRTPDGGAAGDFSSPHGTLSGEAYKVEGTFYAGHNGFSSGKVQDFIGKGGTDKPGAVNETFLEWFSGKKPNDWEGTNNPKYPGGSGGAGNLRGGAGGAGYAGGSGGIMSGLLVGTNVGGGGGGSSFVASSLNAPTEDERAKYVTNLNLSSSGGAVYISYMPSYNDLSYLDNLSFSGSISKYFDILSIEGTNSDGSNVAVGFSGRDFEASGLKAAPSTQATIPGNFSNVVLTVKPVDGFMGGNDVPLFAQDNLKYTYTRQSVAKEATMELVEKCAYANVPYAFELKTFNYTKSGSPEEPCTELKGADLFQDNHYLDNMSSYLYDFIASVTDYSIENVDTGEEVRKDQTLSLSETTSFEVSYTVIPKTGSKAIVGEKLTQKTFTKNAKVNIVAVSKNELNGNEMTYKRTLNYNPEDGTYDLTFDVSTSTELVAGERVEFTTSVPGSGSYTVESSGLYYLQAWGGTGGKGGDQTFGSNKGKAGGTRGYSGHPIMLNAGQVITYTLGANGQQGNQGNFVEGGQRGGGGKGTVIDVDGTHVLAAAGSGGGGGASWASDSATVGNSVTATRTTWSTASRESVDGEPIQSISIISTQTSGGYAGKNFVNQSYFNAQGVNPDAGSSLFSVNDYTETNGGAVYLTKFEGNNLDNYYVSAAFTDDFVLNDIDIGNATGSKTADGYTAIMPTISYASGVPSIHFTVTYNLSPAETCLGGVDIKLLNALTLGQPDTDGVNTNDVIKVKDPNLEDDPNDYPTDFANVRIKEDLLGQFSLTINDVNYIQGEEPINSSDLYDAETTFTPTDNLVVKQAGEGLPETVSPNQTTDYAVSYGIKSAHEAEKAVVGPNIEPLLLSSSARVNVYHVVDYALTNISVECPTTEIDGVNKNTFIPGQDYVATFTPGVGMELPEAISVTIDGHPSVTATFEDKTADERVLTISGSELTNTSVVRIEGEAKEKTFKLHYLVSLDAAGMVTEDHIVELKAGLNGDDFADALSELIKQYPPEGATDFAGYTYSIEYPDGTPLTEMPPYDVWINGCYHPNPHSLTIHYVDENGVELADAYVDSNETCYNKKDIDVLTPEIENYAPIKVLANSATGDDTGYAPARIQFSMPDSDVSLYVVYQKLENSVVINYQCKDPQVILPKTEIITGTVGTTGTFNVPKITGYVADQTSIDYTITAEGSSYLVTYEPASALITFNVGIDPSDPDYIEFDPRIAYYGHEVGYTSTEAPYSYEDSTFIPLPTPIRVGYTFMGWYSNGFLVDGLTIFDSTETMQLLAMWKKTVTNVTEDNSYVTISPSTITYDGDEHEPTVSIIVNSVPLVEGVDYDVTYPTDVTNAGQKEVLITFKGDYSGELKKTYEIVPKNIPEESLDIEDISGETYSYTGSPIAPRPYVKDGETPLQEGVDFEYLYENNVNKGNATLTIHFLGNYSNTPDAVIPFEILGRNLPSTDITVGGIPSSVVYDGTQHTPDVTVTAKIDGADVILTKGVDYIVSYGTNTEVGDGTVTIKFINNCSETADVVKTFAITPASLDPSKLSNEGIDEEGYTYTGNEIKPSPLVVKYDGEELTEGIDFEIEYVDNIDVNSEDNHPTAVIHFIGNYEGNPDYEIPFEISPKAIHDPTNPDNPVLDVEPLPTEDNPIVIHETGSDPDLTGIIDIIDNENGLSLEEGVDFIVVIDDVDEGTAHIEFIGDYEGTDNIPLFFDVQSPEVQNFIEEAPYTGEQIKPEVVVTFDGEELIEGIDYIITYGENTEVGEDAGTVTITYIGEFSDIVPNTVELKFDIVTNEIDAHYLTVDYIEPMTYTGSQLTPSGEAVKVSYNGVTLTENVDYVLTYGQNVHAGEGNGIVYIELIGGYSSENTKTVYFDILPKVVTDPSDPDTGLVITPTPDSENPIKVPPTEGDPDLDITIYDPVTGEELRNPEDYEVVIDDIEEGTAHIEFKGDYEGTDDIPVYFEVTEIVIDEIPDQPYTGEQSTPEPHITFDGEELVEGEDYWVEYGDNDETGEGTIIIHYIGDFEDVTPNPKEITFTIEQSEIDVNKLDVADVDDQNYTGSQITPEPTVTYNGVELTAGKDFVYIYGENVHAGDDAGEITIRFIGGFDGEDYDLTFNILPKVISDPTNPDNPNGLDIEPLPTEGEPIVVPDNGDEEPDLMPIEIIDKQTGEELTNPEDFEIVIDDLEEGTAHIEFKGDYEGTPDIPLYFEVQEIQIGIPEQPYTGEPVTPEPIITFDGEELVEGIDYDVYYSNNTQPGKATATIVFKGDYAKIDPKQVEFGIMSTTLDNSAYTADGRSTVIVGFDEGFSSDMTLYAVLQETVPDEIKNQASLGGRFYGTYGDYEIKLLDKDGNEVQPSDIKEGTILTLMIELPEELQGRDVKIVHYHNADDISLIVKGDKAGIGTYVITEEGYLVTLINKFSNFSLIYEETCLAHWFMITAAVLNILLIGAIIIMGKKQSKIVGVAAIVGLAVVSGVGAVFAHCTICWVALGVNGLMILFDILFFAMWKGKAEPEPQPQVVQAQPQVVYVQAPAQAAPAPVAQPAPAPVDALSLKASIVKASSVVSAFVVTKELVASYLINNYKDAVELNRKENYTSTNLPLADTHYVKLVDKKACFIYVYELKNNKSFFIVRTTDEIATQIKEKHSLVELSAFPHTNDGAKWFTIMFDETYKCAEDVYEVIDLVLKGFLAEKVAPAPAPVEELSLHDQMEKAATVVAEVKVNKEVVASYLSETYKDAVIVNRKPNYTKTGLPLADTHYVKLEKNVCVMYVYELNDGKSFLIVKTSNDVFEQIREKHPLTSISAFPHTNDGGKWYSVMFDDSYKSMDDVHEVIDLVINSYLNGQPVEQAPEVELSLHDQMEKAHTMHVEIKVNKEMCANYLLDAYKDVTIVNRKPNYTKTGLPLADTHYVLLGEDKKACFMYVYELNDGNAFAIFKTSEEIYKAIKAKHGASSPSAFPHTNDGGKWYSVMFDSSFKSEEDVHEVIDMVINGFEKNPAPVKEEPKPVEVIPEPAPVVEEADEAGINFMYKFSFSARLIRAGADRQDFYNEIKNEYLSYKKVNSKISWGHELFKLGRIKLGQMKVKGKTLCVYLPLDPKKYDQERLWFKETGDEEFPMMMQVKSDRAVKYVKELIADVMANNEIPHIDNYEPVDYRLPEMTIEEMLKANPPLAKLTDGAVMPQAEEKPVEEPKKVEEPVVEPAPVEEEGEDGIDYKYKFSFSARLIRAGMDRQEFYNAVKNEFLAYKKVNSKISWGHELFKLGRIKLGQMKVKGKTLCVYLPLDPSTHDQERLHFKDLRAEGKEVEFAMMLKITSDRAVKYAAELIAEVMANNELPHLEDYQPVDYKLPEMSVEKMLKEGLAKENNSTVSFGK